MHKEARKQSENKFSMGQQLPTFEVDNLNLADLKAIDSSSAPSAKTSSGQR